MYNSFQKMKLNDPIKGQTQIVVHLNSKSISVPGEKLQ